MPTLRAYQALGRDFLAGKRHALLADEMRVGKTPQAILAAQKVGAEHILVVCPAIAVPQWGREFGRWWRGPQPKVRIRSYDKAKLERDVLCRGQWDVTIIDECHFAKNPEAERTKLIYGKEGLGWYSSRMWALSGTPAPKHAGELWCMLRAFGVVHMTYDEYIRRYCALAWDGRIVGTKVAMVPELKKLLKEVMLRRTRKEVAPEMPDIGFDFLEVTPASKSDYAIPAGLADDEVLTWCEAHQAANAEDRQAVALAKAGPLADEVAFAIENDLLKQTVVFGWHVAPLVQLTEHLTKRGIATSLITGATPSAQRERAQEQFRSGEVQVICANILAAGTAIDLSAASHAYMLEMDWVPGNNVQAVNRLISMDKAEKVTVDVVTWPGSTDDRVQKVLLRRVAELAILI